MTTPHHTSDFLHDLRRRSAAEGGVFWVDEGLLALFEPHAARQVSGSNWHRLVMHDRLIDMVRRRTSHPVRWTRVRGAWLAQLHRLSTGEHHATMLARMEGAVEERLGEEVDLVRFAQDLTVRSMLPVALSGLTTRESARISQDLNQKLVRLIALDPLRGPWRHLRFTAVQVRAGLIVRRVLRQRSSGRRPRELDLADPIVELLPELGMDRALDVVTAVLTAIAGPPGAAAASVLYELARQPDWNRRLTEELAEVDPERFCESPATVAPVTHRFVKEVLRMWSPPLVLMRQARQTFDLGTTTLVDGQSYLLSPHLIHRDTRYWKQADAFDPDRFLPGAPHGPADKDCYVPFGWAPKNCVGADIATVQLMMVCYLMLKRYRLAVPDIEAVSVAYRFAPVPQEFRGTMSRR
ncbi:cytochrome P450 [Streptomyces beijiangensis]|uniref:Cytochrome P450 n=1 Tax=Streptomyces beijiangensis TaxID=163361 RepID=A0A939F8F4_9ACTN|nr:cytochrome P450 [Streptomyces beijiangensis]MBO0513967.1 cytochrome P450 [Streptomyces beijiangensis]